MLLPSRTTAAVVGALAVIGLAACGGGEDPVVDTTAEESPMSPAPADETPDADDATGTEAAKEKSVRFRRPKDGATVQSPFRVAMRAPGLNVQEAGEVEEDSGHFHIMVDTPCLEPGETIPEDETHLHFGDGSRSTELELAPGEHTLCLQFADGAHTAMEYTDEISIVVEEGDGA